jgi:hypothetical protein
VLEANVDGNVVLDLHAIAYPHTRVKEDVLTQRAIMPDDSAGAKCA